MKKHLMIDLETLSTKSDSVIIQIGAVAFDLETGETFEHFKALVNPQSCVDAGLKMSVDTIAWWMQQDDDARELFSHIKANGLSLNNALHELSTFIHSESYTGFWGNGVRFDLGILESAYDAIGVRNPIPFWLERDVRTMDMLNPEVKRNMDFVGTAHDVIADCEHQIKYVCKIYKSLSL